MDRVRPTKAQPEAEPQAISPTHVPPWICASVQPEEMPTDSGCQAEPAVTATDVSW